MSGAENGGASSGGGSGRRRSLGRQNTVEDQALNMIHREVIDLHKHIKHGINSFIFCWRKCLSFKRCKTEFLIIFIAFKLLLDF